MGYKKPAFAGFFMPGIRIHLAQPAVSLLLFHAQQPWDDILRMTPIRLVFTNILLYWLALSPGHAHEFWLEPLSFKLEPDDPVKAHIKVGQYFKGNTYAYLPHRFESFRWIIDEKAEPVDARLGSIPAVSQVAEHSGLGILAYESTYEYLTYDDPDTFKNFLKLDGLTWVAAEHNRRNLPSSGFTEAYRRFAKAYVGVGEAEGNDRALGLPLEWVLNDNPYRLPASTPVTATLLWQGEPMTDTLARIFTRQGNTIEELRLETDDQGTIVIPYHPGTDYLISSVHMVLPGERVNPDKQPVWESLWASAVFRRE